MRLVIQRVSEAKVTVEGNEIGSIERGLCVFLGVAKDDTEEDSTYLAQKTVDLRIFADEEGKFNRTLVDMGGEILVVSQFTLYGDCTKGRRPSFSHAAAPEEAERLYQHFVGQLRAKSPKVATGQFQAKMNVSLVNDGPVTFIIDSK